MEKPNFFNRKVFKRDLRGLSKKQVVFFVWLCAVRAFPFHCDGKSEERSLQDLYNILYALDAAANTKDIPLADFAANAAASIATTTMDISVNDYADVAYEVATNAVTAAYVALYVDTDTTYRNFSFADTAAAYIAKKEIKPFITVIQNDIERIKNDDLHKLDSGNAIYGEIWHLFQRNPQSCGCEYWAELYTRIFMKGFMLDQEELNSLQRRINVPREIRSRGAAVVADYLIDMEVQGAERLNEARIIILGEKGAGKTALARRLINLNAPMPKVDESTEGVDNTLWEIKSGRNGNKDMVNAHIWDFAGHVVTHAVHRCFLSERCLYIIVYDGRTEERNRLEYWLEHIVNYGGDSKALVLVNLRDDHEPEIEKNWLINRYPFILGFYFLSIKDDSLELSQFRDTVTSHIVNNPSWNKIVMPSAYYQVKDILRNRFTRSKTNHQHELISLDAFNEIATLVGIEEADALARLLESLHELGICLWYKNLLHYKTLVLNPEWICHGIYKLINWAKKRKIYNVTLADYTAAFAHETQRYIPDLFPFLLNLMCEYELAYKKECEEEEPEPRGNSTIYVVPFLLRKDQPANKKLPNFPDGDSLLLEYVLEKAIPPDTISRFIVRRNAEIAKGDWTVWRRGVILDNGRATAMVKEEDRKIQVYVKGKDKSSYLNELRKTLNSIFDTYKSKKPELLYRIIPHGLSEYSTRPFLSEDDIIAHLLRRRSYFDPRTGEEILLNRTAELYNIYDATKKEYLAVSIRARELKRSGAVDAATQQQKWEI